MYRGISSDGCPSTLLEQRPQPVPTGFKVLGRLSGVCDIGVCRTFLGHLKISAQQWIVKPILAPEVF